MHPNESLLRAFYAAFQRRDAAGMAACYLPEAEFSDPAFPGLKGGRIAGMWRMLCERATDLEVTLGAKGVLLGWLPPVQARMRRRFADTLDAYLARRGAD